MTTWPNAHPPWQFGNMGISRQNQSWSWSFIPPQVGLVCIIFKSFHFLMFTPLVFSRSIICSLCSSDHQTWLDLQSHSWAKLLLHSNNRKSAVCLISQELPPSRCYTIITVKVLVRTDQSVCSEMSIHTVCRACQLMYTSQSRHD